MRWLAILALLMVAGSLPAASGVLLDSVQGAMQDLISKNTDSRSIARDAIQKQFESSPGADRTAAVDELLSRLKSSSDASDKLTAAITLSKLKSPWEASDHDSKVRELYQLFLTTSDPTFRRFIDDALANAKGLYLDAINDFNADKVDNPAAVAAKFQRMPTDFSKSRYAASSAYYLGQYWTRVALKTGDLAGNIPKSDAAFASFIAKVEDKAFATSDFLADGYYFQALNRIIVGKDKEALDQLAATKQKFRGGQNIYVYQLFYKTKDKSTEIDRYIPVSTLVDMTTQFVSANPGRLPGAQSELAAQLLASKF